MKKFSLALLPLCMTAVMTHTYAEDAFDPNGQYLLGDWNGKRTALATEGLKFDATIATDGAYLADGGYDSNQSQPLVRSSDLALR